MPVWKIIACKKGISFIGKIGIKEFHLGKRKFHLNMKDNGVFAKNFIASYKSGTNSSLQTIRKDNLNKLIFSHLNINSFRISSTL